MTDLSETIAEFRLKLPGWWFTIGECSVSCDATVGPDVAYCPKWMLVAFDDGISVDLPQPSTLGDALNEAVSEALEALEEHERNTVLPPHLRAQ